MTALPGETYGLAFPTVSDEENPPYVSTGRPHHEACAHHVKNTFNAKRAYIIASASLSRDTDEVEKLKAALGDRLAGVRIGISPHTPWDEVVETTRDALAKKADCLITIGGGSLIDGAKAMLLFMVNGVLTVPDVLAFGQRVKASHSTIRLKSAEIDCVTPTMPLICIPTTLSGGEYSSYTGGTHPETHHKLLLRHPFCGPRLIINDPKLTITSPEWVWLSTGVRAIDHCVEAFCRLVQPDEEVDAAALRGFELIVPNLLATKRDWADEGARRACLLGVNTVMIMLKKRVMVGGSHGIGHQLGPLGVGHGQTSCILLPSVMKYNARANAAKQDRLARFLWDDDGRCPAVAALLRNRGLSRESSDAGDALDAVFRELGMPRSLKEVGVGRDRFAALAANSVLDPACESNPIPLTDPAQVIEILEMCAG